MLVPSKYILTPKISQLLSSIEASREVINSIQIPPEVEINIRRQFNLKSSLFSARIEGNLLTLDELSKSSSKNKQKIEVFNILRALNWIQGRSLKDMLLKDILKLHSLVLAGLIEKDQLGKLRKQASAIFNSAGITIYMTPRPSQIEPLLNKLQSYINSSKEPFVPIKALLTHFIFEKIHPFLNGNGRVGRLLIQLTLKKENYDMEGLLSLEEYLDNHRSLYYSSLEDSERDVTGYLEFMLEAMAETAQKIKELVLQKEKADVTDYLLPRRAEILNIIKDHGMVSFNDIQRRFMSIPPRTLSYDLKKLQEANFIRKRGTTKGVHYEAN